ncbi:hypothetical protein [Pseudoruegeria sp. HB172150]|uniref:hypothetical protein n=1 Tax=Pseudoruegeria sp. HB172150 TaxID=2721164 RepID=UPI0015571AE9|nr:hypothetical protein [Pseudoruegeria sp. HB172150]
MSAALISLAASIGAPLIEKILSRKIGADNAELVTVVGRKVAEELGVSPDQLDTVARDRPEEAAEAIQAVEPQVPELIDLYSKGLEYQLAVLQAEGDGPAWTWKWRPLMMYLIGFLWFWHFIGAYVVTVVSGAALPPGDPVLLFKLTGIYMGLYMGGHTLKDVVGKWAGRGS